MPVVLPLPELWQPKKVPESPKSPTGCETAPRWECCSKRNPAQCHREVQQFFWIQFHFEIGFFLTSLFLLMTPPLHRPQVSKLNPPVILSLFTTPPSVPLTNLGLPPQHRFYHHHFCTSRWRTGNLHVRWPQDTSQMQPLHPGYVSPLSPNTYYLSAFWGCISACLSISSTGLEAPRTEFLCCKSSLLFYSIGPPKMLVLWKIFVELTWTGELLNHRPTADV